MNGLDHIDLRRHISAALDELLDELDDRQAHQRCDGGHRLCEHPNHTAAAEQAHRLVGELVNTAATLAGALFERDEIAAFLEHQADLAVCLRIAVEDLELATACTHICPTLPRAAGDTANAAWDLLDRLEGAGFRFTRVPMEVRR